MPRVRFTVRCLIAVVILVALVCLPLSGRSASRSRRSRIHADLARKYEQRMEIAGDPNLSHPASQFKVRADYHRQMAAVWMRASWMPWVADPTPPPLPPVPIWFEDTIMILPEVPESKGLPGRRPLPGP